MRFKHNLSKFKLVSVDTNKPVKGKVVQLTWGEVTEINYALAMNKTGVRYQKV